jgi:nucleoid-associated protein YgaU
MKRYSTTPQKLDKSGIRVYGTTYYPEIPIENSDVFIYSKVGDRLDLLAHNFYGDSTLWWVIAKANGIRGIAALYPATPLRIPGNIVDILEKFRSLNKRR